MRLDAAAADSPYHSSVTQNSIEKRTNEPALDTILANYKRMEIELTRKYAENRARYKNEATNLNMHTDPRNRLSLNDRQLAIATASYQEANEFLSTLKTISADIKELRTAYPKDGRLKSFETAFRSLISSYEGSNKVNQRVKDIIPEFKEPLVSDGPMPYTSGFS